MTEILTESFCERCGTRYTFESIAPGRRRLGRIRIVGRGLKNFVMSDDSSLDEAMAAARSEAERDATSQQLDAFHRTFNFCMSCRQYTCGNCWNAIEARCLSCAPLAITETPEAPFADLDAARLSRVMAAGGPTPLPEPELVGLEESRGIHAHVHETAAGPAPELQPDAWTGPEPVAEAAIEPAQGTHEELAVAEATEAAIEPAQGPHEELAVAEATEGPQPGEAAEVATQPGSDRLASGAAAAPGILGLEIGANLDDAIAAYEASLPKEAPGAGPRLDVVGQPTWAGSTPPAETEPEPEPADEAADTPAPEAPAAVLASPPFPPAPAGAPQWPTGPRWPTAIPAREPLPPAPPSSDPLAALMARKATEAMWAASSRDVVQTPMTAPAQSAAGVQPCVACGISLSANARFCRRCGTSQVG